MDFLQASFLVAFVLVLTDTVKTAVPKLPAIFTPFVAIVVGIVGVAATAHTVWSHDQLIGGIALDKLDAASQAVGGVLLGLGAGLGDKVLNAIRNVGQNESTRPPTQ